MKTVFIVGKYIEETKKGAIWEFQGVFTDRKKAEMACQDHNWFVGPSPLNAMLPIENMEWPGCYYPKSQETPCAICGCTGYHQNCGTV